MNGESEPIRYIDSHTEGEPTRVIIAGGPDLGSGPFANRRDRFREGFDQIRTTVIHEPRGNDSIVGALICEPNDLSCVCGAIFFNNNGFLGMCGHAAMGLAVTLYHQDRIGLGKQRLETPVGVVEVDLHGPNDVSIENVPSFRLQSDVTVNVGGLGTVTGDIAWGGNWFFLADESPFSLELANVSKLTRAARRIRRTLNELNVTGTAGSEIDHVEFCGPARSPDAHSRNFVYCPGGAYDRSPCGTGTSAKLACLAAEGTLRPGEEWIQESIIGSRFRASYRFDAAERVIPTITGQAFICGEGTVIQQASDPFRFGIAGAPA